MIDLYKIIRTFQISPKVLVSKFSEIPLKKVKKIIQKKNVYSNSTYSNAFAANLSLKHFFNLPSMGYLEANKDLIFYVVNRIKSHEFDLLGSGAVNVAHNATYKGLEGHKYFSSIQYKNIEEFINKFINPSNQEIALLNAKQISGDYRLIDWQCDFKSGYRWDESKWTRQLSYGNVVGVDVKVPWELGRLQHLPILAYSYSLINQNSTDTNAEDMKTEFQNQVIDFYISNPPAFGIQWHCAMDVGIRLVNLLVSYSFFVQAGASFDDAFVSLFNNMISDHIHFVTQNAEWSSGMRGNHYFANICSLLIAGLYLSNHQEYYDILYMAASEFANEVMYQFNADGSNFEASLPYHYFCVEMLLYTLAALQSQNSNVLTNIIKRTESKQLRIDNNQAKFSKKLDKRLQQIIDFSFEFLQNDMTFNIGDNDSGKFLKLMPSAHYSFKSDYDLSDSLSNVNDMMQYAIGAKSIHSQICNNKYILKKFEPTVTKPNAIIPFNDFGLYKYQNDLYSAVLRCGSVGQRGKGGHAHNDQLSLCLKVRGIDVFVDNGTYNYTALRDKRNQFRSTSLHNTLLIPGMEQNIWATKSTDDLFWLKAIKAKTKVFELKPNEIASEHSAFGAKLIRRIVFGDNELRGSDSIQIDSQKIVHFHLNPDVVIEKAESNMIRLSVNGVHIELHSPENISIQEYQHSPSYGVIRIGKVLTIQSHKHEIEWTVKIL